MGWTGVNKLKLDPDKMKLLLVGSGLVLESGSILNLAWVALIPRSSVCNVGIGLDLPLLFHEQSSTAEELGTVKVFSSLSALSPSVTLSPSTCPKADGPQLEPFITFHRLHTA